MLNTYYPATDSEKVKALADDMLANGWQGAPIVCYGAWGNGNALTGSHRLAAWELIHNDINWIPETITWQDVAEKAGMDPKELEEEFENTGHIDDFNVFFTEKMPS